MFRKRRGDPGWVAVGIVINAAPYQLTGIGAEHVDHQNALDELRPVRIRLSTTGAATLFDWTASTVDTEIDTADAAVDDE